MKLSIVKNEIVFCLTLIRYDSNDFLYGFMKEYKSS